MHLELEMTGTSAAGRWVPRVRVDAQRRWAGRDVNAIGAHVEEMRPRVPFISGPTRAAVG